jgi:hypothetical protein
MIALCREHHDQADAGAFTVDQLRALKADGRNRSGQVSGRFNWMRRETLAIVGGNFYYETPIAIQLRDQPVIWWNRDDKGVLLLNLAMLTASGLPRARIEDNYWITEGIEADIESPPSGKQLRIDYPNGDHLRVEFRDVETTGDLEGRYETQAPANVPFPLTAVEIEMEVADTPVSFSPRKTELGGATLTGCWMLNCGVGVQLG